MAQAETRPTLVGNHWMLVGTILYLTEFVVIGWAAAAGVGTFAVGEVVAWRATPKTTASKTPMEAV